MTGASLTGLEWRSLGDLSTLLRRGDVSPVELTCHVLTRIEALDKRLGTYIEVFADDAIAAARTAETEINRGRYRGALHGIPIGIKDVFDIKGRRTTFGSRAFGDQLADADAAVVGRLRRGGAIILGKHNLHECAFGVTSENPHFGDVHNPWNEERIAGGSSGGTAAAIAAGLCIAGIGTDTGGSVRIPAAYCGIVGLKPTQGLVSRNGARPLSWSLDHVGPLTRTADDCLIMLDALTDVGPWSWPRAEPILAGHGGGVRGLRIGLPRKEFFDSADPEVASVVCQALAALEADGARVQQVAMPQLAHAQAAGLTIMATESALWHSRSIRERPADYGADVLTRIRLGAITLGTEYLGAQQIRAAIQDDFSRAFSAVDVIVGPTVSIQPPPIGQTFELAGQPPIPARALLNRLTVPANLAGIPAVSVPCGIVDGMPVGMQIMGPAYADHRVLSVARRWMELSDWHAQPVPF